MKTPFYKSIQTHNLKYSAIIIINQKDLPNNITNITFQWPWWNGAPFFVSWALRCGGKTWPPLRDKILISSSSCCISLDCIWTSWANLSRSISSDLRSPWNSLPYHDEKESYQVKCVGQYYCGQQNCSGGYHLLSSF